MCGRGIFAEVWRGDATPRCPARCFGWRPLGAALLLLSAWQWMMRNPVSPLRTLTGRGLAPADGLPCCHRHATHAALLLCLCCGWACALAVCASKSLSLCCPRGVFRSLVFVRMCSHIVFAQPLCVRIVCFISLSLLFFWNSFGRSRVSLRTNEAALCEVFILSASQRHRDQYLDRPRHLVDCGRPAKQVHPPMARAGTDDTRRLLLVPLACAARHTSCRPIRLRGAMGIGQRPPDNKFKGCPGSPHLPWRPCAARPCKAGQRGAFARWQPPTRPNWEAAGKRLQPRRDGSS